MLKRLKRYARGKVDYYVAGRAGLHPSDRRLIARIQSKRLTYLSHRKLVGLATTCRSIQEANLPGVFLEAGCALGGSAILIASLKPEGRPLLLYDVFETIPPPSSHDPKEVHERYETIVQGKSKGIGGDAYYGYQENLFETVRNNLVGFGIDLDAENVRLIKGLVQDTLDPDGPVAFAHVDVDWYEPVMTCLERIFPRLVTGGSIVLDDYHDWGGCRKACDEYLSGISGTFELDDSAGSLKITRIRNGPLANE